MKPCPLEARGITDAELDVGILGYPAFGPNPLGSLGWDVDTACGVDRRTRPRLVEHLVSIFEDRAIQLPESSVVSGQGGARKFHRLLIIFENLPKIFYVLGFGQVQT